MAKKEFKNSKELKKAILKDWEDQSEAHLSQFINSVEIDLASKEVIPQKTRNDLTLFISRYLY